MTQVVRVDALSPAPELIAQAALVLRSGGLVAFPTETVYGLGALATDAAAAARVFAAKDRAATQPLIVHLGSIEQARKFVLFWPKEAQLLAEAFWPGPLSIVLPKSSIVPAAVAGGGETVALRAPAHPVALALVAALGEAIAAPSANRSSRVPPVRAEHVLKGLDGRIEMVVDAGVCPGGLESTVVGLSSGRARVLRRGAVSLERLSQILRVEDCSVASTIGGAGWIRQLEGDEISAASADLGDRKAGALLLEPRSLNLESRVLGRDPAVYAAGFYDALHALEDAGCGVVFVENVPSGGEWDAIRARLERFGG